MRLSHDNLRSNAASIATYLEITPADRAVTSLPLHYCYGLSVVHSHLLVGASLVLTDLSVVDECFWTLFREAGAAAAIVGDLHLQPAAIPVDRNLGPRRLTVLGDIGQRLNHDEVGGALDLVRLAIPRRTYTQSHIDYVIEVCERVRDRAAELRGFRIVDEPPVLRHFTARFEPL